MRIHQLLQQRPVLLRQARLANAAFAYHELGKFAARIARARLRGRVTLRLPDPDAPDMWPALVADEGSQAVLDEHFLERDVLDLADLLAFAAGDGRAKDITFRIEELNARFRSILQRELEEAGIRPRDEAQSAGDPNRA